MEEGELGSLARLHLLVLSGSSFFWYRLPSLAFVSYASRMLQDFQVSYEALRSRRSTGILLGLVVPRMAPFWNRLNLTKIMDFEVANAHACFSSRSFSSRSFSSSIASPYSLTLL